MKYVDAHCHVQFDAYDPDRDAVIAKMKDEGVGGIVVGCDFESSKKAVALAEKHDHLWASIGLHPNRENDEWFDPAPYRELVQNPKVVAIGECGLDYYRPSEVNDEVKAKQKAILKDQIVLAKEFDKPLILHSRPSKGMVDAYEDVLELLKEFPTVRGDVHFFVGTPEIANKFVELGFTLSFTAVITFAREYDTVIKSVPLTSILSETDSPYVPPTSRPKGSRNDPLAVQDVVAKISEIRDEDLETVRAALVANARGLFGLK